MKQNKEKAWVVVHLSRDLSEDGERGLQVSE